MDPEQLYETCFMQVYSYVITLCRDRQTAEEITEETFFRAMTAGDASRFRNEADEKTWLCSIARNLFYDEMRRWKRVSPLPDDLVSGDDAAADAEDRDLSLRIHRVLHTLDEPYKEVFGLRVFGELSFAQIGALFGKTETWARVTYHRARLKIKERMES